MSHDHFQLIALDIDGTLLDSAGGMSASSKTIVATLADRGVRTVLCTGRRWRTALPVARELSGAHAVVVCCGGALTKDADGGRTLHADPLASDTARRAVKLYREAGLVPFLLFDGPLSERELLISNLDRKRADENEYVRSNSESVRYYGGEGVPLGDLPLVVYTMDRAERVLPRKEEIRQALGRRAIVQTLFQPRYASDPMALEVHAPTATKWSALSRLLTRWRIPPERVVAIGDDRNDIPMLRAAGLSFAMENATAEVRAAADRVTASNDEDGVAAALREVFGGL